ncbi:MAG: SRPBCC domain-containing protein [Cellulomonas sp.]
MDATPEQEWEALTRPGFGRRSSSARTITDWQPGHPITRSGEWQGTSFEDEREVVEVEAPSYHWLAYDVRAAELGTRVVLEQVSNRTSDAAGNAAENWRTMLDGLKTVAEAAPQA